MAGCDAVSLTMTPAVAVGTPDSLSTRIVLTTPAPIEPDAAESNAVVGATNCHSHRRSGSGPAGGARPRAGLHHDDARRTDPDPHRLSQHQHLHQLDVSLRDALLGNAATHLFFSVSSADASVLVKELQALALNVQLQSTNED